MRSSRPTTRPLAEVRDDGDGGLARPRSSSKRAQCPRRGAAGQATRRAALQALPGQRRHAAGRGRAGRRAATTAAAEGLSPAAIAALFATKPGEVATDVVEVPDGSAIVAVEEVLPAAVEPRC